MNLTLKSIALLLVVLLGIPACAAPKSGAGSVFATPEEAVAKAKEDLLHVLQTRRDVDLGIDPAQLKASRPGIMVKHVEVDFQKLLVTPTVTSLSDIVTTDSSTIAPFVLNDRVVGVAEIARTPSGWKIIGLGNRAITDGLNQTGLMRQPVSDITVYDVPNLQLTVYGATTADGASEYHLNFDRFSLRNGVAVMRFYPRMREEAIRFEAQFGEALRRQRLLR